MIYLLFWFLIHISYLFDYGKLCVSVEVVSVSVEMFARRDWVVGGFVCITPVVIQPYVERGFTFANILRLVFSTFHEVDDVFASACCVVENFEFLFSLSWFEYRCRWHLSTTEIPSVCQTRAALPFFQVPFLQNLVVSDGCLTDVISKIFVPPVHQFWLLFEGLLQFFVDLKKIPMFFDRSLYPWQGLVVCGNKQELVAFLFIFFLVC